MSRATPEQIAALPHCENCDQPMRPKGSKVAEYPGTVMPCNPSICSGCWRRKKGAGNLDPATILKYQADLSEYLHDRRRRGIPAEGLRVDA